MATATRVVMAEPPNKNWEIGRNAEFQSEVYHTSTTGATKTVPIGEKEGFFSLFSR
jgi:hypothetical protein